jgi:hypothetical protein
MRGMRHMVALKHYVHHVQGKVEHYVFVASAGAYKADSIEPMHVEGDARKASAGAHHVTPALWPMSASSDTSSVDGH